MNKLHLFIQCTIWFSIQLNAQNFEWIQTDTILHNLSGSNQEIPVFATEDAVYQARLDSTSLIYDQYDFGKCVIEERTNQGELIWQYSIGDSVSVRDLVVDDSGNVFIGGLFLKRFISVGHTPTSNTQANQPYSYNMFLLCIHPNGTFNWIRNLSIGLNGLENEKLDALAIDNQNRCWYGYNNFAKINIRRINALGEDVQTYLIDKGLILGDMDFDNQGNLFLAGAVGNGPLTINSTSYPVPFSYNFFVSKINASGLSEWTNFYEDISFQTPSIDIDPDGNPVFSAQLFQSMIVDTFNLVHPNFGKDFILAKLNTDGDLLWARNVPNQPGLGSFDLSSRKAISIDTNGHIWLAGELSGSIEFENNQSLSSGDILNTDPAFIQFNASGIATNTAHGGSRAHDWNCGMCLAPNGDMYYTALVHDTIHFGPLELLLPSTYTTILGKWTADSTASIFSPTTPLLFNLFPNPSNGILMLNGGIANRTRILDFQGRIIRDLNGNSVYDLSDLAAGLYFVQIFEKENVGVYRWVKY